MGKKFKESKVGKFLHKASSNNTVRAAFSLTGIGRPVVETIRNLTTPDGQDKPHKSTKQQWILSLIVLAVLLYLGVIDKCDLLGFLGLGC